jgi:hypothetical protein
MTTYTGTQPVKKGIYLNTKTFAITTMDAIGPLPGTERDTYRRIPMLLMLAAAPLLGLAYVMFLPLIGFIAVLHLLATSLVRVLGNAAANAVRVARPSWAPALAFLSRSKPAKRDDAAGNPADKWSENVEKKLDSDRRAS